MNPNTQLCNTHANARGSMASDLVEADETRSWAPAIEDDPTAWTMGRGSTHAYAQCIVDTADMVRHGDGDPRMDFECASVLGAFRRSQIVRDTSSAKGTPLGVDTLPSEDHNTIVSVVDEL